MSLYSSVSRFVAAYDERLQRRLRLDSRLPRDLSHAWQGGTQTAISDLSGKLH